LGPHLLNQKLTRLRFWENDREKRKVIRIHLGIRDGSQRGMKKSKRLLAQSSIISARQKNQGIIKLYQVVTVIPETIMIQMKEEKSKLILANKFLNKNQRS
jgi:hypothetical protein